MTQSNSTVAFAAAAAKQAEADASKAVAVSVQAQSDANPQDVDLLASVAVRQAEATKDQVAADELLATANAIQVTEQAATAQAPATDAPAQQPDTTTPVVDTTISAPAADSTTPQVVDQGVVDQSAPAPQAAIPAAPQVVEVKAAPAVQNTAPVAKTATDFDNYIAKLKVSGTHLEKAFIAQMEDYIVKMAPGRPVTVQEGASNQLGLWRLIKHTLNTTTEFNTLYGMLLGYANAHRNGVFHDRYVFRFAEHFTFDPIEINAFQAVLNLVNVTCVPGDRKAVLKQVDMKRTLSMHWSEEARQRVIKFYA